MSAARRIEELIEEFMERLEREPDFSAGAFLEAHPEHAVALERALERSPADLGVLAKRIYALHCMQIETHADSWEALAQETFECMKSIDPEAYETQLVQRHFKARKMVRERDMGKFARDLLRGLGKQKNGG